MRCGGGEIERRHTTRISYHRREPVNGVGVGAVHEEEEEDIPLFERMLEGLMAGIWARPDGMANKHRPRRRA